MRAKSRRSLIMCIAFFAMFLAFTVVVKMVDVQQIGPQGTSVGLGTLNSFMAARASGNGIFEKITDYAGYLTLLGVLAWAFYGLIQWIKRKDIRKVDGDLLSAGGVFVLTGIFYLLFEFVVINYRPVLEKGKIAASYPSSHTMLSLVVILITVMLLEKRIRNKIVFHILSFVLDAAAVLLVLFRQQSGVHWFSDILGGMILSGALIMLFQFLSDLAAEKKDADIVDEPGAFAENDRTIPDCPGIHDPEKPSDEETGGVEGQAEDLDHADDTACDEIGDDDDDWTEAEEIVASEDGTDPTDDIIGYQIVTDMYFEDDDAAGGENGGKRG